MKWDGMMNKSGSLLSRSTLFPIALRWLPKSIASKRQVGFVLMEIRNDFF
jgi:hypothetical protein